MTPRVIVILGRSADTLVLKRKSATTNELIRGIELGRSYEQSTSNTRQLASVRKHNTRRLNQLLKAFEAVEELVKINPGAALQVLAQPPALLLALYVCLLLSVLTHAVASTPNMSNGAMLRRRVTSAWLRGTRNRCLLLHTSAADDPCRRG